jgi:hypothetical protein
LSRASIGNHLHKEASMLTPASALKNLVLGARDGEIGRVRDFLFDDQTWTIRYLEANTGKWLPGRRALISPVALGQPDLDQNRLSVDLTKQQIEDAPGIETHETVSRQYEARYNQHFDYPPYWIGAGVSHGTLHPAPLSSGIDRPRPPPTDNADNHLRSVNEVSAYEIAAADGALGKVHDCVIDTADWAIRYLSIDVRKWLPGPSVLLPAQWIERTSWFQRQVSVDVARDRLRSAPRFELPLTREQEVELFAHYGRDPYWGP